MRIPAHRLFVAVSLMLSLNLLAEGDGGYRPELRIPYCAVGGHELTLNAFLPEDAVTPAPAMVEIHGGWWHGGGAASEVGHVGGAKVFMRHHLAIFSIEYRLGKEGGFPESIRDCRNAIRFIRRNALRFNIDPARIAVTGGSAGGHLSLMVAMAPEDFDDGGPTPGLEGVSARVSGSFSYIPPTDLLRFWKQGPDDAITNADGKVTYRGPDALIPYDSRPRLRALFHGITPDSPAHEAVYTEMSPAGHVRTDTPPLLICDGERDPIVPGLHGKALYEQLKAAGADATYWMTTNGGHGFPGGPGFETVLDTFVVRALKLVPSPSSRRTEYQFDGKISRAALENYLERSITMEGMLNGAGDLQDNIRMLTNCGAKYIGRALCLWGAERDFTNNMIRARAAIPQVLAADPDMILEACVFETVSPKVTNIAIPKWVFTALGQPVEQRNFRYDDMIYPPGQRRAMGRGAQVPDESRMETQLWFYYQAASYIEAGCEAIHFGQVEIMNKNDRDNVHWEHLLTLVRQFAATHARRHMVLCNGHVPSGGLMRNGNPLLDFHAFPLRIMEVPDKPKEAVLKVGFSDGLYLRSKGGLTFSGWRCDHLPYLVEFDNYGVSSHPGQAETKGKSNWVWGYDEITWFAHQSREDRAAWLRYAWKWLRATDPDGRLEMPGSRTEASPLDHSRWYFANRPSPAVPDGLGDEEAISAIWAKDSVPLRVVPQK